MILLRKITSVLLVFSMLLMPAPASKAFSMGGSGSVTIAAFSKIDFRMATLIGHNFEVTPYGGDPKGDYGGTFMAACKSNTNQLIIDLSSASSENVSVDLFDYETHTVLTSSSRFNIDSAGSSYVFSELSNNKYYYFVIRNHGQSAISVKAIIRAQ